MKYAIYFKDTTSTVMIPFEGGSGTTNLELCNFIADTLNKLLIFNSLCKYEVAPFLPDVIPVINLSEPLKKKINGIVKLYYDELNADLIESTGIHYKTNPNHQGCSRNVTAFL